MLGIVEGIKVGDGLCIARTWLLLGFVDGEFLEEADDVTIEVVDGEELCLVDGKVEVESEDESVTTIDIPLTTVTEGTNKVVGRSILGMVSVRWNRKGYVCYLWYIAWFL
jgi:hypothetical protein